MKATWNGTVIAEGTSDELKTQVGGERLDVTLEDRDDRRAAIEALHAMAAERPTCDDTVVHVPLRAHRGAIAEAVRLLDEQNVAIDDIAIRRPTLDDVFMKLTGRTAEEVAEDDEEQQKQEQAA